MPGNSQRRGAIRKPGSKKGAQLGSGGNRRRGLEGKGPTPKAVDRPYHPAARKKATSDRLKTRRQSASQARESSEFIVGRNAVLEALQAKIKASALEIATGIDVDERTRQIVALANKANLPFREVSRVELDRRSPARVHQGVALQVPPYDYSDPLDLFDSAIESESLPLFVALDSVTDPHNLGAVLRSSAAFGAQGVIIPARRSASMGATAWKVSAGAAARVPVARATNLVRALQQAQERGYFVVGLDAGGTVSVESIPVADSPVILVTGSEGKGLSRLVAETCDVIASIPISGDTESLNAAVATGIALYEVTRLRSANAPSQ